MIAWGVLLGLLLVACVTDIRWHKIYNWTTYPGMVFALALNALAPLAAADMTAGQAWLRELGCVGWQQSLGGLLLCGGLMVVCFVFFHVGAGDVKLLAMMGAFFGPLAGIEVVLWTFVIGAGGALIVLVWRVGPLRLIGRAVRQVIWALRIFGWPGLTEAERAQLQPPLFLAPSALLAALVVHYRWL